MEALIMRILVTGGLGYIGGRLSQHLSLNGFDLIIASRRTPKQLEWAPRAQAINISWDNSDELYKLCDGVNCIVHAAGMNANDCLLDPLAAIEFNGYATGRLVEAACRAKVDKFVLLSTAHVYNSSLAGVINEKTTPRNIHPYATSNLEAERILNNASLRSGIKTIILRLSNVFGPPSHHSISCWNLFVNDICRQLSTHHRVKINGNPNLHRDFVPMSHVLKLLTSIVEDSRLSNQVFSLDKLNVSSQTSFSLLDMAMRAVKIYSSTYFIEPSIIHPLPSPSPAVLIQSIYPEIVNAISPTSIELELETLIRYCHEHFPYIGSSK